MVTEQLRTIERIESKTKYYENAVDDGPKEPIDTRKDVNNPNLEEDKIMNIGTYSEACSEDGLVYTKVLRVSWTGRWLGMPRARVRPTRRVNGGEISHPRDFEKLVGANSL